MRHFIKHLIASLKVFLKIKTPSGYYYEEKDTSCDNCKMRKLCEPYLCDVTYSLDKRQHILNGPDYTCPKEYFENDITATKKMYENVTSIDETSLYPISPIEEEI